MEFLLNHFLRFLSDGLSSSAIMVCRYHQTFPGSYGMRKNLSSLMEPIQWWLFLHWLPWNHMQNHLRLYQLPSLLLHRSSFLPLSLSVYLIPVLINQMHLRIFLLKPWMFLHPVLHKQLLSCLILRLRSCLLPDAWFLSGRTYKIRFRIRDRNLCIKVLMLFQVLHLNKEHCKLLNSGL